MLSELRRSRADHPYADTPLTNVLSPSGLSSPSIGVMSLVALLAEQLGVLFLPGGNHVRWAGLTLRLSSESVRVVHDEWRAGLPAVLALTSLGCMQGLPLLVAPSLSPTHEREWLDVLGFDHLAKHGAPLRWFVPDEHPLASAAGDVQSFLPADRVHPVMCTHHPPRRPLSRDRLVSS